LDLEIKKIQLLNRIPFSTVTNDIITPHTQTWTREENKKIKKYATLSIFDKVYAYINIILL
jgi:hypothetical protein